MNNYPVGVTGNESYFNPDCMMRCAECGAEIDTEQDYYGESIDGEDFCCSECMTDQIKCRCFKMEHNGRFCASGRFDDVEINVFKDTEKEALSLLDDWFSQSYTEKCYIERD